MEAQQQVKRIKLFDKQFQAINFKTQFCAVVCGVQSGKTFLGCYWAMKKIQEFPKSYGAIIAPTYKILQQSTLPKFFQEFPQLRKYYKSQKGEISLPTGGTVFVRSADNPLGIEGMTLNWWWLDEGGMTSTLTWTVLRSRVSMTGGQGLITTTPYNMLWLYRDFYLPWKDGLDNNLDFYSWKSVENPFFSQKFYDAEKRRLKPEEFARRYMGQFQKMTGLVYDLPTEQIIDPKDIMKKSEIRVIGVDWGFRNPAAVVAVYCYDNVWYVADEWRKAGRTTEEIRQVIKNMLSQHHATKVYPDPAEPDRIEECRRDGIPVMEVDKDIKGGVSYIQQLIREKRFYIFNTCPETIDEINMYHYPEEEEDKAAKDLPEKFEDHLMDAMRYAIYSTKQVRRTPAIASEPALPYYPELGF